MSSIDNNTLKVRLNGPAQPTVKKSTGGFGAVLRGVGRVFGALGSVATPVFAALTPFVPPAAVLAAASFGLSRLTGLIPRESAGGYGTLATADQRVGAEPYEALLSQASTANPEERGHTIGEARYQTESTRPPEEFLEVRGLIDAKRASVQQMTDQLEI